MRNSFTKLVLLGLLTACGIAGAAVPASAAPAAGVQGQLCMYSENDFGGGVLCADSGTTLRDLGKSNRPDLQDAISSIANHSGQEMCFFTDNNFRGTRVSIANNEEDPVLGAQFNDAFSSFAPCA